MFIDFTFLTFLIIYGIIVLIMGLIMIRRRKGLKKTLLNFLVAFYALLLIKATLFPLEIDTFGDFEGYSIRNVFQIIPFSTIKNMLNSPVGLTQILGNILLLFPVPFIGRFIYGEEKIKIRKTIFFGIIISFAIETLQMSEDVATKCINRVFDIDDIILNISGVVLGIGVVILVDTIRKKIVDSQGFSKIGNSF